VETGAYSRRRTERSWPTSGGVDGAKGGGQGECGLAKHAPNTASGWRVTGAGPHTESRLCSRLAVTHPRWEPYAGKPHVPALCGGRIVICVPTAIRIFSLD
jgi:hypothetical protein